MVVNNVQYFLLFYLNSLFMSMCVFIYRKKKKKTWGEKSQSDHERALQSMVVTSSVQESKPACWPKVQETLRQNHASLTLRLLAISVSCCDTQYFWVQKHILTLFKAPLILPWSSATNRMLASAISTQIMHSCAQHTLTCLWKWSNQNTPCHMHFIQVTSDACKKYCGYGTLSSEQDST